MNPVNMAENGDQSDNPSPNPIIEPQSDFWSINGYKKAVKRVDDGSKLCDDLMKMITERSDIENNYANKLQGWSKKWTDVISKGPEYGSCKSSWLEIATEAEQLSTMYRELQAMLLNQVCESISTWKGQHYHKSLLSWKETKTAEEGFSKAHKPYAKRYDAVMKCKKSYFTACAARDQIEKQLDSCNTQANPQTEEQTKKLNDRLTKAKNDVVTTQNEYKEAIRDITNYHPKYKEDMVFVFEKLQQSEGERKVFMKSTMQSICQVLHPKQIFERPRVIPALEYHFFVQRLCMRRYTYFKKRCRGERRLHDRSELWVPFGYGTDLALLTRADSHLFYRFSQIHDNLSRCVENCDPVADVSWWGAAYGTNMPFNCLQYEEYNPHSTEEQVLTRENQERENVCKAASPADGTNGSSPVKTEKKSSVCTTL